MEQEDKEESEILDQLPEEVRDLTKELREAEKLLQSQVKQDQVHKISTEEIEAAMRRTTEVSDEEEDDWTLRD
jgi:hypothetical protein